MSPDHIFARADKAARLAIDGSQGSGWRPGSKLSWPSVLMRSRRSSRKITIAHISDEKAQELVDKSEGWITGLQLSSLDIVQGVAGRLQVARAAGVDLFDYLGEQVLDQQPEEIRFFLLRSSLLEEFDAALCEDVFGELYPRRKDWHLWINSIIQNNLFALPVGHEIGWVRYHHLFRDFLQDHLTKEHPEEIPPILQKLAQAYEARNEWEKAYHIQKRLEDVDALAGLIERAAPHLLLRALVTLGNMA